VFYIEVSAKINMNVDKLFEAIADKLPKNVVKGKDKIVLDDKVQPPESSNCQKC
jgi:hypothetical protein